MKYKATLLILFSFLFTSVANAQDDTYGGIQFAMGTYSEDGFPDTNPNAIVGRFGKRIEDDFFIEGRFGFGIGDDTVNYLGVDVSIEIDTLIGVYAVKQIETGNNSSVYGILGFTQGELTASALGVSVSDDDNGLSFGVGATFSNINIEFMQYMNKSDFDISAISVGIMF